MLPLLRYQPLPVTASKSLLAYVHNAVPPELKAASSSLFDPMLQRDSGERASSILTRTSPVLALPTNGQSDILPAAS